MLSVKFDEKNKEWSNLSAPLLYNPNISLGHILLRSMELFGPKIAQVGDDTKVQLTFEEIRLMSIRAAQNLQKRGYGDKQIVGFNAGDVTHLAPIAFAALYLGCTITAMNIYKPDVLQMLEITKTKVIFCEADAYDLMVECLGELGYHAKIFTFNGTKGDSEAVENLFVETGIEDEFIPVEVDGINDAAFILNTSGTTGPAKGVCISHASLCAEIVDINIKMYTDGVVFHPGALNWICGILALILGTVCGAKRIISNEEFELEMELRLIKEHRVTVFECLPYDLYLMLKEELLKDADLTSVKHVIISGYKYSIAVQKEFNSYLPNGNVHNVYGLTEFGDVSIDFPYFSGKDTAGRLVNGKTVKIIDEQGNRCGVGVNGEICVKGRFKFLGYYNNKELTDEIVDKEGFFLTGDIGLIDNDGYLYICDRKKNIINTMDEWVFPSEIEETIQNEFSDIKSVYVVGVPDNEDGFFEMPAAFVECAKGSSITEGEIQKLVEAKMRKVCQLRGGVYFIDTVPVSTAKKPLRRVLKEQATKLYQAKNEIKQEKL